MGMLKKLAAGITICLSLGTNAHAFCFDEAGAQYGISPQILRAIAKVESNFNPAAVNRNNDGTIEVGLMQINSVWAAALGKAGWNALGDACYNTKTGAWILSQCIAKYGYNWEAIACYRSRTPDRRDDDAQKVFAQLQRVAPVAQEASYSPLKSKWATLVREEGDESVQQGLSQRPRRGEPAVVVEAPPAGGAGNAAPAEQAQQEQAQQQDQPQQEPPQEQAQAEAPPQEQPPAEAHPEMPQDQSQIISDDPGVPAPVPENAENGEGS